MESRFVGALSLVLLRSIAWLYGLQPAVLRDFWGRALGVILRKLNLRAKVVRQNLELAFPADARKREQLFNEAYRHLGSLVFEILMLLGPMKRFVLKKCELRGAAHWRDAKAQGKGVIFLASHVGNWEIMAATGALHGGMDLMLVTKHLKPEWLHRAIEAGRTRCGVRATYEPKTLKDVLGHLKRNGTVGIVLDQYAGPPIGVRVPVFGVPVGTSTAIAALARRTGAAILPVVNYRTKDGWVVDIRAPLGWREVADADTTRELAENTAAYSGALERDILDHPEQWLWIHRRFKGDLSPLREGEWDEGRARR
jgi:KDO2-lipid IV(A) lauroyltransferase